MSEQFYYIICIKHSSNGSWDILFWGPDRCGYTIRLDDAGKYTKDNMPNLHPGTGFAVPCEEVDAVAHRSVDRDNHLFIFMNKHLPKKSNGEKYHYGDIFNG